MSTSTKPTELQPTELQPTEVESKALTPIEPEAVEPESTELPSPQGWQRLRSNKWFLGSLVLIPILGILAYRQMVVVPQQQAKSKIQTAPVERSNLTITISANGTVQPERSVNVSPKTAGILKQLLVKEGDAVEKGQVLAYMDDSNLQGQLQQSQGNLAAAVANVEKLRNGNRDEEIATAQAQLAEQNANLQKLLNGNRSQELAETQAKLKDVQYALRQANDDLQRNQALYTEGAISLQSLNTFRTTRDRAQSQVTQAEQAASLMRSGTRPEEIAQAEAVVNQKQEALALSQAGSRSEDIDKGQAEVTAAQGAVQIIQASLDDMILRAPFAGVVARKFADPGAFVTPTTAGSAVSSATSSSILALASTNQIMTQVAEANIAQTRIGLVATIQVDAYPGETFTGKITQIATQSVVVQNVTSFEVKASVADPKRRLKSGMNVNVAFKAGELNNVLIVPTASIVQQPNAQGVFVAKDKGDPVFVPITVGTTVNDKTEVKSGLTGNERVLLSFPPGTRKASDIISQ
jgi:HlyD family secretion protein